MSSRQSVHIRFRYLLDPLFLFCVALYSLNRRVFKTWPWGHVKFFHSYLNDIICIPFWLPPLLLLYRKLGLRDHDRPPQQPSSKTRGTVADAAWLVMAANSSATLPACG